MYVKQFITTGLDKSKPLFFDTETLGLYGRTRLIQVRQGDVAYEYDCFYINIEIIKDYFKDFHLVLHNSIYDLSCPDLKQWNIKSFDDTLLLARQAYPYLESFSLGGLAKHFKLEVKGDEGKSNWGLYNLTSEQLDYASKDTLITEQVYNLIPKEVFECASYKLDIENIKFACLYQNKGMVVHKKNVRKKINEYKKLLRSIDLPEDLNVNSPKQVTEFFNIESSDFSTLQDLSFTNPQAKAVLDKRHALKAMQYLETLSKCDLIYSKINPVGANSGRFTSKGSGDDDSFNLQQIPRELKSVFGFNEGEGLYVCADYPTLEIWLACAVMGETSLASILTSGEDLHKATASKIFNISKDEVSKDLRQLGKSCNFSLLYGAGAGVLSHIIKLQTNGSTRLSLAEADNLRAKWLRIYPKIALTHQQAFNYFKQKPYKIVTTPMGRKIRANTAVQALNYPVQGGGAECTKLALFLLKKEGIIPVNCVHDSIALIASNPSEAEEYAKCLKWCMEEAFRRVIQNCKIHNLSLNVDVEVGLEYC